ncbi:MAG: hypothetical protein EBX52_01975 [Proteobacteria bacterium]|nr:hypothetical protein [Pseudomonadota bacterium]
MPGEKARHSRFSFPEKQVYHELPTGEWKDRPFEVMGWVRSKAVWPTLDQDQYNEGLCRNYFNKAARGLLQEAKKAGADAVIQVRSVVFLLDGKVGEYPTAECSDDGAEGEVLVRGIAIKFKPDEKKDSESF